MKMISSALNRLYRQAWRHNGSPPPVYRHPYIAVSLCRQDIMENASILNERPLSVTDLTLVIRISLDWKDERSRWAVSSRVPCSMDEYTGKRYISSWFNLSSLRCRDSLRLGSCSLKDSLMSLFLWTINSRISSVSAMYHASDLLVVYRIDHTLSI